MPASRADDPRSDQQLIAAINRGDVRAFDALYHRYRDWVVNLSYRFCGNRDDALDVAQETFTYLLSKFPGFVLTAQMKTFLYPAVRNLSIAASKKRKRFAGDDDALAARPGNEDDPAATSHRDLRDELARVMASLSDDHREVVLLRYVDGLPLGEIAIALDIPLGTVKSRLHHAIAALRDDEKTRRYFEP